MKNIKKSLQIDCIILLSFSFPLMIVNIKRNPKLAILFLVLFSIGVIMLLILTFVEMAEKRKEKK